MTDDPRLALDAMAEASTAAPSAEAVAGEASVPVAQPGFMGRIGTVVSERLARLIHPDPRVPDNFADSLIAGFVNSKLGPESEEAKLGQSVALCVDVLTDGDVANLPPAVHLGFSGLKYRFLKKKSAARQAEQTKA